MQKVYRFFNNCINFLRQQIILIYRYIMPAQFNNLINTSLVNDSVGNIYLLDAPNTFNTVLRKLDPSGNVTTLTSNFQSRGVLAIDPSGNCYTAAYTDDVCNIVKIDEAGNINVITLDTTDALDLVIESLFFIKFHNGYLYAVNGNVAKGTIFRINSEGVVTVFANVVGHPNAVLTSIQFDSNNNMIVIDQPNGLVFNIDLSGNILNSFTHTDGQINSIVLDSSNNIYIASNAAIFKYDASGNKDILAGIIATPGFVSGYSALFSYELWGITLVDNNIFVGDASNYRIRKLTNNGGSYITTTAAGIGTKGVSDIAEIPIPTITVSPSSSYGRIGGNVIITGNIIDQSGNILIIESVYLSNDGASTPGSSTLMNVVPQNGTYTYTVTNSTVETTTYIVMHELISNTATVSWVTPVLTTVTVSPSSSYGRIGGNVTITATVLDQFSIILINESVYLSNDGASTPGTPQPMFVVGDGTYTYIVTNSTVETTTYTVTDESISNTATVSWEIPVLTTITVSPSSSTGVIGGNVTITATVLDQFSIILINESVYLSNDGASTPGTPQPMFVVGDGTYTYIVTNSTVETTTYTVTDESISNITTISWISENQAPCFLEGTKILCQIDSIDTYIPIEKLTVGTLVKTRINGYKKIVLIGKGQINNPGNDERLEQRLYKLSPSKYTELNEELFITGCHSTLVEHLTDKEKKDTFNRLKDIFITEKKYRLMACVDEKAEPWNSKGTYTIWHFALENSHNLWNYGVYANGLLVETCCIYTLKNKSKFTLFN